MADLAFMWRPFKSTLPGMSAWVTFAGPFQYAVARDSAGAWFASVRLMKGGAVMTDLSGGVAFESETAAKNACRRHWDANRLQF
jgi:hypothetical protein